MATEDEYPLRTVGWGPFRLPSERKRMQRLKEKYDTLAEQFDREAEASSEGSPPTPSAAELASATAAPGISQRFVESRSRRSYDDTERSAEQRYRPSYRTASPEEQRPRPTAQSDEDIGISAAAALGLPSYRAREPEAVGGIPPLRSLRWDRHSEVDVSPAVPNTPEVVRPVPRRSKGARSQPSPEARPSPNRHDEPVDPPSNKSPKGPSRG